MRSYAFILLLFPLGAGAQEELANSLLWRIVPPGGTHASYLYGTVHSRDDRAFQFGDSVLPALDRCATVAGELDLTADKQMAMALMTTMRMPDGKKLADLYKKRQWERVEVMMKERFGVMAPMVNSVKPFFILAMFSEGDMGSDREVVLDQYLQQRGQANGQRVIGIETVSEQLAALDAISLPEQADMLLKYVDNGGYPGTMDAMLNAYARQDLEALVQEGLKAGGMPEEFERSLLTERNLRMVERMHVLLQEDSSTFFLIGAAHLPQPNGLIAGLRAKGHSVEAVMSDYHAPVLELEER